MIFRPILIFLSFILPQMINSSKLKLVQVLCRHGDRTPVDGYQKWYPADPYVNEVYAPVGFGGLTEVGRNRSFALGQFIRDRYFPALQMPPDYSSTLFRIRTSDVDRCKKTAKSIHEALFPDTESIPIHHEEMRRDSLFLGTYICPTVKPEMARVQRSMRRLKDDEEWTSFQKYLSQNMGVEATKYHAFILQHTLMAQESLGLPLPSWTSKIYPSELCEKTAANEYILQSYNNKLKRINGGQWVRELLHNMENVARGKDHAKLILYVGHETNIAGLLSALNIFEPHIPGFCSCIMLEMHQDTKSSKHFVKVFYKNYEKFEELQIPGCSQPCSLKDFRISTKHLRPRNVNKECGLTD